MARKSLALVRGDRALLALPIGSMALAWAAWAGLFAALRAANLPAWLAGALAAVLVAYPAAFMTTFFAVAFVAVLDGRLDGRRTRPAEGIGLARARLGLIARWALLAAGVGLVLRGLRQVKVAWLADAVSGSLVGAPWSVIALFAVPVIAFEDVELRELARRSSELVERRWSGGAPGRTNIAAFWVLVLLPVGAVGAIAIAALVPGTATLLTLACATSFLALTLIYVQTGLVGLTLYRYATAHRTSGDFTHAELHAAFARPSRRRRQAQASATADGGGGRVEAAGVPEIERTRR